MARQVQGRVREVDVGAPEVGPVEAEQPVQHPPVLLPQDDARGFDPRHATMATWPSGPTPRRDDGGLNVRVALTFDDGPGESTATLLSTLAHRGVRATFFMVGCNVDASPELVRAALADGHEVGNHTYDHPDLTTLDRAAVAEQIDRTTDAIARAAGMRSVLARPPFGATSEAVVRVLQDSGHTQVLWDLDSQDWLSRDAVATAERVLTHVHDGVVILLHDIVPTTVVAMPGIVDALQEKGFTFVTVSDMLAEPRRGEPSGDEDGMPSPIPT